MQRGKAPRIKSLESKHCGWALYGREVGVDSSSYLELKGGAGLLRGGTGGAVELLVGKLRPIEAHAEAGLLTRPRGIKLGSGHEAEGYWNSHLPHYLSCPSAQRELFNMQ